MDETMYSDFMNGTFNSSDGQREETKGNVVFHRVPLKNAVVMLMNHPSSVTLYNHVSVEVLSGSVSVCGYEINQQSPTINVFSSEKTGLIEIKTESFDRIWKKKAHTTTLQYIIHSIIENERKTRELMEKFGNSTVAIFLKIIDFPMSLKFLEQYYPSVVQFDLYDKISKRMLHVSDHLSKKYTPIHFGLQEEKLSAEINGLIRSASLNDLNSPRIIVCGPKNSGKSSLIRFLINKILSEHTEVCHLETDSGQTEFTPPGVFSLTKVSKPVIGPPFYHQLKPVSMVFSGSVSPTSPVVCAKAVNELIREYLKKFKMIPLLVNTIGWMDGVGLEWLGNLIQIVKPTVLVEIVTEEECSFFDYREFLPANSSYHQICCSHIPKNSFFSPKELREMSLLSYFSNCQPNIYFPTKLLNEFTPRCVPWEEIAIYSYHNRLLPSRMIEAMIESIVALCSVENSKILESNIPLFPKTLEEDPVCDCLGYGFVSAVDEERHLMYVISPLDDDGWRKVNAIIKGNVAVPDCLILNQENYDTELPYTDEREINVTDSSDEDQADVSMVSLKSFSAAEAPSIPKPSPLCYNRAITKRYQRKRK